MQQEFEFPTLLQRPIIAFLIKNWVAVLAKKTSNTQFRFLEIPWNSKPLKKGDNLLSQGHLRDKKTNLAPN